MRSLAREESEESPEESDLKKLASVTVWQPLLCPRALAQLHAAQTDLGHVRVSLAGGL